MEDNTFSLRFTFFLALYIWIATVAVLVCITIWPQEKIWLAILSILDFLLLLPLVAVKKVKHYTINYKCPLLFAILALVISTFVFVVLFQAISNLRGIPVAAFNREDRYLWDPFPWGGQGLLLWYFTYNYRLQKRNNDPTQ